MRVTVVGCSGSVPGPGGPASCYLVEADDDAGRTWRVVLDLGNGSLGALQRHVDPVTLDGVLLSHLHADHCLDLCGLYVMVKHRPGVPAGVRVPVWGPTGTAERVARAYDTPDHPGEVAVAEQLDCRAWRDREPVRVGPLTVTPVRVHHPVEAYGLRVEAGGAVLAFTGDTDACEALSPLCTGADLVLADSAFVEGRDTVEGIHLSGRRAGAAVTAAGGVRRLVLTHVPPWNDVGVCLAEARSTWDGPLEAATPGAVYDL
ncbi:MBL fold metallo-hydrolase [Angustibacter aerolatus]